MRGIISNHPSIRLNYLFGGFFAAFVGVAVATHYGVPLPIFRPAIGAAVVLLLPGCVFSPVNFATIS